MSWKLATPFRPEEELSSELQLVDDEKKSGQQLCRVGKGRPTTLPGNPFVDLGLKSILRHLESTLFTTKLDAIAQYLWILSTPSSSSISPLHKQKILGREVLITDSADLHLLWYHSKVLIKPLPSYLLSHAFWTYLLDDGHGPDVGNRFRLAAIGFVRSYCHLIQSNTDFRIAVEHGVVPEGIDFEAFAIFIDNFKDLPDTQASPRFHYGELRLTRLNFWSMFLLRRMQYFNMSRQYETYFSRFFQPLLFAFGTFSVLLSAMQVALAAEQPGVTSSDGWSQFVSVSKWTSIATILIVSFSVVSLLAMLIFKVLSELFYALGSIRRERRSRKIDV